MSNESLAGSFRISTLSILGNSLSKNRNVCVLWVEKQKKLNLKEMKEKKSMNKRPSGPLSLS